MYLPVLRGTSWDPESLFLPRTTNLTTMLLKIEKHWVLVASLVHLLLLVPCLSLATIAVGMTVGIEVVRRNTLTC